MKRSRCASLGLIVSLSAVAACGGGGSDTETARPKLPKTQRSEVQLLPVEMPDGSTRDFGVFEPQGVPTDAVFVLDSYSLVLPEARHPRSILIERARDLGFLVVAPKGIDDTWNVEICCGSALVAASDDVTYIENVADFVGEKYDLPAPRLHLVGWSGGGMMAYRMACEASSKFGDIAIVEGVLLTKPCAPSIGVDLLHLHQTADPDVPYGGTRKSPVAVGGILPSVQRGFTRWLVGQSCTEPLIEVDGPIETRSAKCRDRTTARLVTIEGGSGEWPASDDPYDVTTAILDFFGVIPPGENDG